MQKTAGWSRGRWRRYVPLSSMAMLVFLAMGCGGSNDDASSVTLSGTAVQGAMSGATVTAFAVNTNTGMNGRALRSTTTGGDGSFRLRLSPAPEGPVRLTASGGAFSSEMDGATISTPSTISALIARPAHSRSGISINPLSEFVSSRTVGLLEGQHTNFNSALRSATDAIESFYGLSSDPATIIPDYTAAMIGTDAGNLGLVLGALINEDQVLCPSSVGGLVDALSADIQDGYFTGYKFTFLSPGIGLITPVPYCGSMLSGIAGTTQFQDALSGLNQLATLMRAFAFGGTGNILTTAGIADVALNGSNVYPSPPLAVINSAIAKAAPPSVNQFENPQAAVMNAARQNAVGVALRSGLVLIAGGAQSGILASTDLYDPGSNSFADPQNATMSAPRAYATGTRLPNGNVLIAGGSSKLPDALASSDIYISASNCFAGEVGTPCESIQRPPDMNGPLELATATLLANGKVLIAAGNNGFGNAASSELYDPINNCFAGNVGTPCEATHPAFMNRARDVATATLLPNGKVLIAGGLFNSDATATTELYDSAQNCFAGKLGSSCVNQIPPVLRVPRLLASAVLLPNGKVLIAGGFNVTDGALASTELYDPDQNCFAGLAGTPCANIATPTMNVARQAATITLLPNGKVLIAGGSDPADGLASVELYDPENNCFAGNPGTPCGGQTTPMMNEARQNDVGILLNNGLLLMAGGGDGVTALDSTDLYIP